VSSASREARLPLDAAPAEGEIRLLDVNGHSVGLFRVDGYLHALADRCPHRGAPICSGKVVTPIEVRDGVLVLGARKSVVRCPWHKWEFDLATGRCLSDERLVVRRYAVRVDGADVVVTLDRPSRATPARPAGG
jgi:3-phenylpropionate/trans-cinnamate dioxygenase ferredoxin subunit